MGGKGEPNSERDLDRKKLAKGRAMTQNVTWRGENRRRVSASRDAQKGGLEGRRKFI